MNSPFANIFLALQQHILTAVPAITFIDQDLGQLRSKTRPPVSWPCVLIDIEDCSFTDLGNNVQAAKGTVLLRLGFEPRSNSTQATPTTYTQQAISFYDLEWTLHKVVQGWSPLTDAGSFSRISAATQSRTDHYRVREIRYSFAFEDYSAKWQLLFAPATLSVDEDFIP